MIWVLLSLVLMGAGIVFLLLSRGRNPQPEEVGPESAERTRSVSGRAVPADTAQDRLDRALAAVIPDTGANHSGTDISVAYSGAGARLAELFRVDLRRTPSPAVVRFAQISRDVAGLLDEAGDPYAGELSAIDATMRDLRLVRADVEPMGIVPVEVAVERYAIGCGQRVANVRADLLRHLDALGVALRSERGGSGADLAAAVDRHVDRLLSGLDRDSRERARLHRSAFEDVRAAADRVTTEVAEALVRSPAPNPLVPVSAAAAVVLVGGRAAGHLERQVAEIVPMPGARDDSAAGAELAADRGNLLVGMDRNAAAFAAIDGVVMAVLGAESVEAAQIGMGQCVAGCAAIPPELTNAVADIATYLHSADFDSHVQQIAEEFLPKLANNLLPGVEDSPHSEGMVAALTGVHQAVNQMRHSLVGELVTNANPALGALKFVGYQALDSAKDLGELATQSPVVEEAIQHVGTAFDAFGDGLGHAVDAVGLLAASHIPFVTLILSTKREIERHREYGTTVGEGLASVVLDVGGIWVGVGAAAGAATIFGLHGGPAVLVTVPGAVAGSLATRQFKKWRLAKATEAFEMAAVDHAATVDRLHREFSAAVDAWLLEGRDRCAALPRAPRPPEVAAVPEPLAAPMRTYRTEVEKVLAAADQIRSAGRDRGVPARRALARAETVLDGHSLEGHTDGGARVLELATIPVPLHPGWGPSREFVRHCASTARVLRDRADEHHALFGRWVHRVNTLVQAIRSDVEAQVESDVAALVRGRDAAKDLVDAAAREVEVRASAMRRRRPAES